MMLASIVGMSKVSSLMFLSMVVIVVPGPILSNSLSVHQSQQQQRQVSSPETRLRRHFRAPSGNLTDLNATSTQKSNTTNMNNNTSNRMMQEPSSAQSVIKQHKRPLLNSAINQALPKRFRTSLTSVGRTSNAVTSFESNARRLNTTTTSQLEQRFSLIRDHSSSDNNNNNDDSASTNDVNNNTISGSSGQVDNNHKHQRHQSRIRNSVNGTIDLSEYEQSDVDRLYGDALLVYVKNFNE